MSASRVKFCDSRSTTRSHLSGALAVTALTLMSPFIADPTGFLRTLLTELFPPAPVDVVDKIKKQLGQEHRDHEHIVDKILRDLAGDHAGMMIESVSSASSYLQHPDSNLRRAALLSLQNHWKLGTEFGAICEKTLLGDDDTEVRSLATILLAGCYAHSDDKRIGNVVAALVYDQNNPVRLRTEAYRALHTIRGMPVAALISARSPGFRFPEDVDWAFVQTFLKKTTDDWYPGFTS